MRHGQKDKRACKAVASGEILSVVFRDGFLEYWINKEYQGKMAVPGELMGQSCFPYVGSFCSGDAF